MADAQRAARDGANGLDRERDVVAYLVAAFDGDRPAAAVEAIRTVSNAGGISGALRRLKMTRAELQEQVMPRGRPKIDIAMKLLRALGLKFVVSS